VKLTMVCGWSFLNSTTSEKERRSEIRRKKNKRKTKKINFLFGILG